MNILRLGVFDRPGVLDRIAGIIRRNGYNILSLNAGRFAGGKAFINIVLDDPRADMEKLGKLLLDIGFVSEYHTIRGDKSHVRELALFRMKSRDFDAMHYPEARVLSQNEDEVCFEVTAVPDEIDALLTRLEGRVLDCVRSGALAVYREEADAL